jgi:hypothetical protein
MATFSRGSESLPWTVLAWITIATFTAACASLPPAKPVTNVSQIAGKWQGTGYGPGGAASVTQTINPDGSYSAVLPSGTFTGKITISDGKLRGKSDQSGNTGTYALHDGEGRRVLVYKSDDGRISSELTPAK